MMDRIGLQYIFNMHDDKSTSYLTLLLMRKFNIKLRVESLFSLGAGFMSPDSISSCGGDGGCVTSILDFMRCFSWCGGQFFSRWLADGMLASK